MTQISLFDLYNSLSNYGDVYQTKHRMRDYNDFINWTEENFDYVRYNPRKKITRYDLSITSLDGGLSGIPDLDSLLEYNRENNTEYSERDFSVKTPIYEYPSLKNMIKPISDYIFRSHILKLEPGGFFPPHRDFAGPIFDSFRALVPLSNMNPPSFNFMVDNRLHHWENGHLYFVDTAKMHYLFNCSFETTYMIVFNIQLNQKTVEYITRNLKQC